MNFDPPRMSLSIARHNEGRKEEKNLDAEGA
jgi:hypothetical protein